MQGKEVLAFLGEDQDREHLKKLNMHKSVGLLQGTHRCQLPWKGHGGLWEVPEDWKKAPPFTRMGGKEELQAGQPDVDLCESCCAANPGKLFQTLERWETSQYGFMKWKSYVTKLIPFQNEMIGWMESIGCGLSEF